MFSTCINLQNKFKAYIYLLCFHRNVLEHLQRQVRALWDHLEEVEEEEVEVEGEGENKLKVEEEEGLEEEIRKLFIISIALAPGSKILC